MTAPRCLGDIDVVFIFSLLPYFSGDAFGKQENIGPISSNLFQYVLISSPASVRSSANALLCVVSCHR